ncbi:TIGR00730 family Rossman fold protein [Dysgonomonas sp. 25]|uniref:LOG family protein n=1 Tax=Dysgonomonas sp. 25 TaxID=2302933 RepID=UPI00210252C3|nr:TIGR00730 family Rossman fold protein [Dysgonomonas sp. 25]
MNPATHMKYITVFCGSSEGGINSYMQQAYATGKAIAARGYGLVYGGAHVGLMGAVADGALDGGTEAIGIIPTFLNKKELAHPRLTETHVVSTMHERKTMMFERCDAIIALPGGFGTMEELFEVLTWAQLNLHQKPIGLLNINGYYDALITFIDQMAENKFLKPEYKHMLLVDSDIEKLLGKMEHYVPQVNDKWFETAK